MNPFLRWVKFNVVGTVGMGLQLTSLAILNRALFHNYLAATAIAVELTILHNFFWHQRYTWADRRDKSPLRSRLLRFHLSNGFVSMAGNLALMSFFVRTVHLPIVAANAVAILCCSVANFILADFWAFASANAG
jgi:putative flippase GtrA